MFTCKVANGMFQDVFGEWDSLINRVRPSRESKHFDVNMLNHDDKIVVTADLPGVQIDDLSVTVENGILAVSGERLKQATSGLCLCERADGKFYRSFEVPTDIDQTAVSASLKNGVLTLVLPRKAEAKPRKIEIKS